MPASTSSKTSVAGPASAAALISASITRESSPPEAMSRSGPAGTPGFGAIRNSTSSAPLGPCSARSASRASNVAPSIARSASTATTVPARPAAASVARRAQLRRALGRLGPDRLQRGGGALGGLLGAGQLVPPRAAGLRVGEHRGDRAAVLALELLEQRQALLDLVQPAGRRVDRLAVAPQLARQVLRLDRERARPLGEDVERRVDAAHRLQGARRAGQRRRRAVAGLRRERLDAAGRRHPQPLQVAQPLALGGQLGLLGLARRRGLDLAQLPLEQVELAVARAGPLAQRRQLLAERRARARGPPRTRHGARPARGRRSRRGSPAATRPASACGARAGRRTTAARRRRRAGRPPWRCGRSGTRACAPRRSRGGRGRAPRRPRRSARPAPRAARRGSSNTPSTYASDAPGRTMPGARLAAEQQVERVREHGLARPRLAREHVEPGREAQLGPLDQQEVLDAQLFQHAAGSTSRTRRTRPSAQLVTKSARSRHGRGLSRHGPPGTLAPMPTRPIAPAGRSAPAAGDRSSRPGAARGARSSARTRRGCPRPAAARRRAGRRCAPRPARRATGC